MAQPSNIRYAPETCLFCRGKATRFEHNGDHYRRCPICRGLGSLLVAQPARKCAFCDGKCINFWRDENRYRKCPACKAYGWAHALPPGKHS